MTVVCIDAKTINSKFEKLEQLLADRKEYITVNVQDRLLTREETAQLLKISLPTLWDWTNRRKILQSYRICNAIRYKEVEVLAALVPIGTQSNRGY